MLSPKLLLVLAALLAGNVVNALWPLPRSITTGPTGLVLSPDFKIEVKGPYPSDLQPAVARTLSYIRNDKHERLVVGRGSVDTTAIKSAKQLRSLVVTSKGSETIATEARAPLGTRDEAYVLNIPSDGSPATLSANSTLGLFRGLTTFSQVWYTHDSSIYTVEAPISISDSPAFPYRGFMLDTARNYFSVDVIKRQLDAMSWVKQNTFHWHIVDSQSFPLVVPGYEAISSKGAYSSEEIYTPSQIADIVRYANERGIDVIAEIDTPGHTSAISKSFPEHIACPEASPWTTYANEPPAGQLRLASSDTIKFTTGLLVNAAKLFPGNYFSTGGDEINAKCYADDPKTQEALAASGKTFEQALDVFTQAEHRALKDTGKTAVVWQEMVLSHQVTLANDTVIMVWISSADAAAVVQKGFRIVHAPSDYFYLDCGGGGWVGDFPTGNSWCDPFKTWQKAYSFNPYTNISESQRHLVLGGQQLLWTEQSSPNNIDPIVWPRAAASAEVFWSGPGGNGQAALARLHDHAYRITQRGIRAIALQPKWCALRPGKCDLKA
ncbi:N-acetylhexosaminidase [Thelephora ganbajun]|uniref:N-acetylhexosaminidase n=1 Tax=Thelephora ganbajun TaxID=370292 RepID=A0ACB6ZKX0_THEGA|nr:N-acetylhexosaminidase [Thelephora ganbajun]